VCVRERERQSMIVLYIEYDLYGYQTTTNLTKDLPKCLVYDSLLWQNDNICLLTDLKKFYNFFPRPGGDSHSGHRWQ
jgi:hypothetical protein